MGCRSQEPEVASKLFPSPVPLTDSEPGGKDGRVTNSPTAFY